jgi:hypothetical protein
MAVIVITDAEGKEVCRRMTLRLYNEIVMPEGSHGKQFMIKASFLKHVDDQTHFGSEPTFSMPLTTRDLARSRSRQVQDDFETRLLAIERHRQELERMEAELEAMRGRREGSGAGR